MKLKDTGLLPEMEYGGTDFDGNPTQQEHITNTILGELGEIDLSAWLKENGYVKYDPKTMKTLTESYMGQKKLEEWGYIKLSQVELDASKLMETIQQTTGCSENDYYVCKSGIRGKDICMTKKEQKERSNER